MNCNFAARILGGCLLLLVPRAAGAQEPLPSFQGFTGLWNTPNALVTPEGAVDVVYNDQIDPRWRHRVDWSATEILSFGMFPHLEGGLRLSTTGIHGRPYVGGDLSANFKVQWPFLSDGMPRLALGMQDAGGGFRASNFRSTYAVISQDLGPLRLSLGGGTGPDRMKGIFGGGELQVTRWLQLVADRDTVDTSLGLKIMTPRGLLPGALSAGGFVKRTLNDKINKRSDAGFYLRIPLGGKRAPYGSRASQQYPTAAVPPKAPVTTTEPKSSRSGLSQPGSSTPGVVTAPPPPGVTAFLNSLVANLARFGFENLRVGTRGKTLVVEYENNRFNHNELDALGLVLGTALLSAPEDFDAFLLVLKKRKLRILEVEGPVAPFRAFFANPVPQAPGILRDLIRIRASDSFSGTVGVQWGGPETRSSSLDTSLILAPGLDSRIGTEFGVFDYQLALVPETLTTLWSGASLNVAWNVPLARSENFRPGQVFALPEEHASFNRALLSQAVPLGPGLMTQFSGGIYDGIVNGVMNETMWSPGNGTHRLWVEAGRFSGSGAMTRNVLLGSYRWYVAALDASLEASGGRFYNQDKGILISLKRNFRDTALELFFSRTTDQMLGIRLTVPLTPRKDMKPGLLQVRGADHWSYGLTTTIRDPSGVNPMVFGRATVPRTTTSLARSLYNADRLSEAYILEHLDRLKEAFDLWKPL